MEKVSRRGLFGILVAAMAATRVSAPSKGMVPVEYLGTYDLDLLPFDGTPMVESTAFAQCLEAPIGTIYGTIHVDTDEFCAAIKEMQENIAKACFHGAVIDLYGTDRHGSRVRLNRALDDDQT